jgi:hypothetical protein
VIELLERTPQAEELFGGVLELRRVAAAAPEGSRTPLWRDSLNRDASGQTGSISPIAPGCIVVP